jgi:hypothetical protein
MVKGIKAYQLMNVNGSNHYRCFSSGLIAESIKPGSMSILGLVREGPHSLVYSGSGVLTIPRSQARKLEKKQGKPTRLGIFFDEEFGERGIEPVTLFAAGSYYPLTVMIDTGYDIKSRRQLEEGEYTLRNLTDFFIKSKAKEVMWTPREAYSDFDEERFYTPIPCLEEDGIYDLFMRIVEQKKGDEKIFVPFTKGMLNE